MNFKRFILEANFARVQNFLRGQVPNVNTLGIITAENPYNLDQVIVAEMKKRKAQALLKHAQSLPHDQSFSTKEQENALREFEQQYAKDLAARLSSNPKNPEEKGLTPQEDQIRREYNNKVNRMLLGYISSINSYNAITVRNQSELMGYIPLRGKFGQAWHENSFLIPNARLTWLKKWAEEFKQQAFIFGVKENDQMRFVYYNKTDAGYEPIDTRFVNITGSYADDDGEKNVQQSDDFYSQVKQWDKLKVKSGKTASPNTKFLIPFFLKDKEGKDIHYNYTNQGRNIQRTPEKDVAKTGVAEFYIPFFDEIHEGVLPIVAECPAYLFEERIPWHFPAIQNMLQEIVKYEKLEAENQEKFHHPMTEKFCRWKIITLMAEITRYAKQIKP